ncbi:hypothetical protein SUDANB38_05872 [Streptomyces sp. enrichment culture]
MAARLVGILDAAADALPTGAPGRCARASPARPPGRLTA